MRWYVVLILAACCQRQTNDACFDQLTHPVELAERFTNDQTFRRDCLLKSLINLQNRYSSDRIQHYTDTDWGSLPVVGFKIRPVHPSDLGRPAPLVDDDWQSLPSLTFPTTLNGLKQQGEVMFTRFPAQLEQSMLRVLRSTDGPSKYGIWQTPDSVGGLVWVALPGGVVPSLTCSSCHASTDDEDKLHMGLPNHQFDLGKAKDDYLNIISLYSTWGPGRQDVAADGKDNPVVIADLRPVRYQNHLHRTANIRNSLVALALRVETGLITAHQGALRPKQIDAFALAYYLWSLGDMFDPKTNRNHPNRMTFDRHCATCHQDSTLAGPLMNPALIQSAVANMSNTARGTGWMRTPSLLGVSSRQRLLYGGEADGINGLLNPTRMRGGHTQAGLLTDDERHDIATFLQSL